MFLGEVTWYTSQAISGYKVSKAWKDAPQAVKDVTDIALTETDIILKTPNKNWAKAYEVTKHKSYKRVARLRDLCTTIVGSKTWNFFKTLSEWKKALKATALKTLRKGMGKLYWAKVKVGSKRLRLKQGKNSVRMLGNKKFNFNSFLSRF